MSRARIRIRISRGPFLDPECSRQRRKGEILHLALSRIGAFKGGDTLKDALLEALSILGESGERWQIEVDFISPLRAVFSLPEVRRFFLPGRKVYTERDILIASHGNPSQIIRPDRIVILPDHVAVIDYKIERPADGRILRDYERQVRGYRSAVERLFEMPAKGYLLFIMDAELVEVSRR